MLHLLEALNRQGTTVLIATHDVNLLRQMPSANIMRLSKGRIDDPTGSLRFPPRASVS
jgi:cell division transport system ATP-binding protein